MADNRQQDEQEIMLCLWSSSLSPSGNTGCLGISHKSEVKKRPGSVAQESTAV